MLIDLLWIEIGIHKEFSNVPMVHNCGVTAQEIKDHGPYIQSALPKYAKMVDLLGVWSHNNFRQWKMSTTPIDPESEVA